VSREGRIRRMARAIRRWLLPSFDLLLLQRCRLLRFIESGSRVLDAGCGDGTTAFRLAARGCRVVGASNDADAIARLRDRASAAGIELCLHDLARDGPLLPLGEGEGALGFDAAVCFDVLEHILDDRSAVAAIAGSLREGGRLLVTVPNRAAPPLWGDRVSATEDGGHVRPGYAREELVELLSQAGLRVVFCVGFGGFFARRATNVSRRLERLRGRLSLGLRFLWLLLMRPLCWLDAFLPGKRLGLFVVAQRENP